MKHKIGIGILFIEAILCVALSFVPPSPAWFSSAMAFPYEQIGAALRTLSLSGVAGNAAAFTLYILISLSPAAALLILQKKRKLHREDGLLILLSIALFPILYYVINPGIFGPMENLPLPQDMSNALLGITAHSILLGYAILRVLRLFSAAKAGKLGNYLAMLLWGLNAAFIYVACGACFKGFLDAIAALKASNTALPNPFLSLTGIFLFMQYIVNALPYLMSVFIIFAILRLVREMQADRYSANTVFTAEGLVRLSKQTLAITVLARIAFNLLQFIFASRLMDIRIIAHFPTDAIICALCANLLARFVADSKQLKDENEQFI
jgi:hypothetical protein